MASALVTVRTTGVMMNGAAIVRLKMIGKPKTAISLILNSTEGSATWAIFLLWLCFEAMQSARTKLKAVPQPPRNTKVSRNVLE